MPTQLSDQHYLKLRAELINRTSRYERQVKALYDGALNDISKLLSTVSYDPATPFSFEDVGLMRQVDQIMSDLEKNIMVAVAAGVQKEFSKSYSNCLDMLKQVLGENTYDRVSKAFVPRVRSGEAAKRFLEKIPTASTRVWNGTTLHQMETAVEGALREGWGASRMATHLKQFLNEPDVFYRRFRIKVGETEDGVIYGRKWKKRILQPDGTSRWVDDDPKKYHPGTGVYRSSYKNALRYAGTTTNIAYRTADYEQYQDFEFVLGIEIRVSENNHHVPDICDELAGKYPKDFKWTGWHPNCRCYQVPVLANKSKVEEMADTILDGGDPSNVPVDGRIEDVPDQFTKWVDRNAGRIKHAETIPYFLADNGVVTDGKFTLKSFSKAQIHAKSIEDIAKERHAARTPEKMAYLQSLIRDRENRFKEYATTQKRAANLLGMAGDWHEIDFSQLDNLLAATKSKSFFRVSEMDDLKAAVKAIKDQIRGQKISENALSDIIPDVHKWHLQFDIADLEAVKQSIVNKMDSLATKNGYAGWDYISLPYQKKLLSKEAQYVSDPNYLAPHTLHKTWEVAYNAYTRKINEIDKALEWDATGVADHLAYLQEYVALNPWSTTVVQFVQQAQKIKDTGGSAADADKLLELAEKKISSNARTVERNTMKRLKPVDFKGLSESKKKKLIAEFEARQGYSEDTSEAADKLLRSLTEKYWVSLSREERRVLTKYTQTYNYLNEPLTGRRHIGKPYSEFETDMPKLTVALNKYKAPKDMVLRRGTGDYYIPEIGKNLSNVSVGDEFTNGCFCSTAVRMDRGLGGSYDMVIVVPKGAHGVYAEPFSHYTDSGKFDYSGDLWNGKTPEPMRTEREWIGQRGYRFRVIDKKGNTIYLEVIGELYDQVTDYASYF